MTTADLQNSAQFDFMGDKRSARFSYRLTASLLLLGGLLAGGGLIFNSVLRIFQDAASTENYIALPVGVVLIFWTLMSACATYLTSARIALSGDSLIVHIVGPWRIHLLRSSDLSNSLAARHIHLPYRRLTDDEDIFTITLSGLRPACRLASLYLGINAKPLIFITPDHQAYEELVDRLRPDQALSAHLHVQESA